MKRQKRRSLTKPRDGNAGRGGWWIAERTWKYFLVCKKNGADDGNGWSNDKGSENISGWSVWD